MTTTQHAAGREVADPGAEGDVVVGFDGSPSSETAVAYALVEATSARRPARLVSIIEHRGLPGPRHLDTMEDKERWTELQRTISKAERDFPLTELHQELHVGNAAERLVELAAGQHLLVVGQRGLSAFSRLFVGSTSIAVAGRASVPVVVVPDGWVRQDHAGEAVVVGVDVDNDNTELLRFAFGQASRRHVDLAVVHAVDDRPSMLWDPGAEAAAFESHVERQVRIVDAMVAEARLDFPLVPVRVEQSVHNVTDALLDASADAQLLVVGRHASGRFGLPYGSVTRAVLHYAALPVAVVPSE